MNNGFQKILLATDGSPSAKSAEQTALKLALRDGAELIIADSIRIQGRVEKWLVRNADEMYHSLEREKQAYLEQQAAEFSGRGVKKVQTRLLHGKSSQQLTRLAIEQGCDLLIRYRKGIDSRQGGLLGTTALNLLRICPCPVLLVNENQPLDHPRVLASVDIQDDDRVNNVILEEAGRLNGNSKSKIGILYCWTLFGHEMIKRRMNPESYHELVEEIANDHEADFDKFLAQHGMDRSQPDMAIRFGDPEYVIAPFVEENSFDVTVMSTIAPSATVSRLLGSTIENVIGKLSSNLLAVKPQGFISPIKLEMELEEMETVENLPYSTPQIW